jgi:hypothetical protein
MVGENHMHESYCLMMRAGTRTKMERRREDIVYRETHTTKHKPIQLSLVNGM